MSGSITLNQSAFRKIDRVEILDTCVIPKSRLLSDSLTENGSLIVSLRVEIQCKSDVISIQKKHCTTNAKIQLVDQYSHLLNDTTFADFAFNVKGKTFKVHKNILANGSETMRAMFTTGLTESVNGECIVDDIEPDIFQHMLQFIYAGILPANLDNLSMDLYKAADYYGIVNLMEICKENIHFQLSEHNAMDIYELSTLYNLEDVRADAWKIVKCYCFKIFFPLKNEPLPLKDFREIRVIHEKRKEFWMKHKQQAESSGNAENGTFICTSLCSLRLFSSVAN